MSDIAATTNYETDIPVAPRYRLVSRPEYMARSPTAWLVKGILPAVGIGSIYGASGSGKSFLTLDLLHALASEPAWFGYRIRKNVPVVYLALEAAGGMPNRIRAWSVKNNRAAPEGFHLLETVGADGKPFQIADADDMRSLGLLLFEALGGGVVVAIDTLALAAGGLEENSASEMSSAILGAKALQEACAGLVLLVHHAGKDAAKGMRGSSALFAAMDVVIEVTRSPQDARAWRLEKSKEGQDGVGAAFKLCSVPLGLRDEDNEEVHGAAVEWDQAAGLRPVAVKSPTGSNQILVLSEIRARLAGGDQESLSYISAVALGAAALTFEGAEPRRAKTSSRAAVVGLIASGFMQRCGSPLDDTRASVALPRLK